MEKLFFRRENDVAESFSLKLERRKKAEYKAFFLYIYMRNACYFA